jgi:hypothetical protein
MYMHVLQLYEILFLFHIHDEQIKNQGGEIGIFNSNIWIYYLTL